MYKNKKSDHIIQKYKLIDFVIDELKNGSFTYCTFIIDTSLPILDNDKESLKQAIKETYVWKGSYSLSDTYNHDFEPQALRELYDNITRLKHKYDIINSKKYYMLVIAIECYSDMYSRFVVCTENMLKLAADSNELLDNPIEEVEGIQNYLKFIKDFTES